MQIEKRGRACLRKKELIKIKNFEIDYEIIKCVNNHNINCLIKLFQSDYPSTSDVEKLQILQKAPSPFMEMQLDLN